MTYVHLDKPAPDKQTMLEVVYKIPYYPFSYVIFSLLFSSM